MEIKDVDFSDDSFLSAFERFCLISKPYKQMEKGSLSLRKTYIKEYLEDLKTDSDYSSRSLDEDGKCLYYLFSIEKTDRKTGKKCLEVTFCFPDLNNRPSICEVTTAFYFLMLKHLEYSGCDLYKTSLLRKRKSKFFKEFIYRYFRAVEWEGGLPKKGNKVVIRKQKIKEEYKKEIIKYEELQIKNNRNKLDDKTP